MFDTSPQLDCNGRVLKLDQPRVMGIVNVTPDSFSDGGEHFDAGAAIAHGLALAAEGADILDVISYKVFILLGGQVYRYGGLLVSAVGIQECARHPDDRLIAPFHDQTRLFRYHCHQRCLEIFLIGKFDKSIQILRCNDYRHALLRLRNSQLRTIQAGIFFLDRIQVNNQTVSQLTDGYSYTACTKVIAALDHMADCRIAEQALDLALCRRITLLNLGPAGLQRIFRMFLG